jgi:hypothetical protein
MDYNLKAGRITTSDNVKHAYYVLFSDVILQIQVRWITSIPMAIHVATTVTVIDVAVTMDGAIARAC